MLNNINHDKWYIMYNIYRLWFNSERTDKNLKKNRIILLEKTKMLNENSNRLKNIEWRDNKKIKKLNKRRKN